MYVIEKSPGEATPSTRENYSSRPIPKASVSGMGSIHGRTKTSSWKWRERDSYSAAPSWLASSTQYKLWSISGRASGAGSSTQLEQ